VEWAWVLIAERAALGSTCSKATRGCGALSTVYCFRYSRTGPLRVPLRVSARRRVTLNSASRVGAISLGRVLKLSGPAPGG